MVSRANSQLFDFKKIYKYSQKLACSYLSLSCFISHTCRKIREGSGDTVTQREKAPRNHWEIWRYKHLVKGVVAQFFYVGAQVGVTSFVIRFTQHLLPGTPKRVAANFLTWHLIGFMIGGFA